MNLCKKQVKELAEMIRVQIKDGKLYGIQIDMDDIDQLIVAAYLHGQTAERNHHMKKLELLR